MTLYNYCKNYLEEQTDKYFPEVAPELYKYFVPNIYSYIFNVTPGEETLDDVMKMLAFILQNRFNLPNVINFKKNLSTMCYITQNFSVTYLSVLDENACYSAFNKALHIDKSKVSWFTYCGGLIQGAQYLNQFKSYSQYMEHINSNTNLALQELCQIKGVGPAMSRNFLKELGVFSLGKPDVHLKDVFDACGLSWNTPEDFDRILQSQAIKGEANPYQLDRIIWLICSGRYFTHDKVIKNGKFFLKKSFIKHLKENIDRGILIV